MDGAPAYCIILYCLTSSCIISRRPRADADTSPRPTNADTALPVDTSDCEVYSTTDQEVFRTRRERHHCAGRQVPFMTLPAANSSSPTYRVMLISTSPDLAAHRERVREALARVDGLLPLTAEPAPAAHGDADLIIRAAVRRADICVLLVAWRYGHVPTGELRSITHDAYLEARAAGMPILVFLADPATDAPAGPNTPFPAVTRDPAHRAQLDRKSVV